MNQANGDAGRSGPWWALAVSLTVHALILALPSSGGGFQNRLRYLVFQPPLPTIDVRFRNVSLPVPEVSREFPEFVPSVEIPPVQELSAEPAPFDPVADLNEGVLPLPGSAYFRPSEVNETPYPLTVSPIELDDSQIGADGIAFSIQVFINEAGKVDGVELLKGSVPDTLWHKVLKVFGDTSYRPGKILDAPVKTKLRIELWVPPVGEPGTQSVDD